ncbi:DNA polymerase IV [Microbacterium aurantiacum]|uniref:DNA polymerase IV n=1 Tax=Microbacterium aurantiacum TaxID=162393 RepID=UPI0007DA82DF|nr:DNA polymerase IV [Microbacterium chocolatum]ANG85874.1 DNA polymerase IV [Microbacterium chocolatum]
MGRGDGTGRLVSATDADDSGTGILHVDMDAFYVAVAQKHDPSLRGKPVIIGAPESRSVVSSASYEARRYGVRSAMPVGQALRLCPTAIVVPPDFPRYLSASAEVMAIFRDVTPLVEPLSIDEAFLDVRGVRRLWGTPGHIARTLRARVLADTGLTCSIGVAATKHVAKMASTISKPDGLLIVRDVDTDAFLAPRPVGALWGVGPKATETLLARGVRTIGDARETPRPVLDRALGPAMGERVWNLARGIDPREVHTDRIEKSIGHEETFDSDIADRAILRTEVLRLADRVAARLRAGGWEAATVSLKLRFADFTTLTRSTTLPDPSHVGQRLGEAGHSLLDGIDLRQSVRLIGLRAERLVPAGSTGAALWDADEDWRRVDAALDTATERFGRGAITRATLLGPAPGGRTPPTNPRPEHRPPD